MIYSLKVFIENKKNMSIELQVLENLVKQRKCVIY